MVRPLPGAEGGESAPCRLNRVPSHDLPLLCQAFAPVWKAAAAGACAARPALTFGAVDCVADYVLCREMGVSGFPSVRVFTAGAPPTGEELTTCGHGCESAVEVLDDVLAAANATAARAAAASGPPFRC